MFTAERKFVIRTDLKLLELHIKIFFFLIQNFDLPEIQREYLCLIFPEGMAKCIVWVTATFDTSSVASAGVFL
jgi:hypothetical protein